MKWCSVKCRRGTVLRYSLFGAGGVFVGGCPISRDGVGEDGWMAELEAVFFGGGVLSLDDSDSCLDSWGIF